MQKIINPHGQYCCEKEVPQWSRLFVLHSVNSDPELLLVFVFVFGSEGSLMYMHIQYKVLQDFV